MRQQWGKRLLSLAVAGAMALSVPLGALAAEFDLEKGDITITAEKSEDGEEETHWVDQRDENDKQVAPKDKDYESADLDDTETNKRGKGYRYKKDKEITIKQGSDDDTSVDEKEATSNTVTIKAEEGTEVEVVLDDVNIDVSDTGTEYQVNGKDDSDNNEWDDGYVANDPADTPAAPGKAAVEIQAKAGAAVELELKGTNKVKSGMGRAGVEKNGSAAETGDLIIKGNGSLEATGGKSSERDDLAGGAGIGGAAGNDGANICIEGGTITATGGGSGAGIDGAGIEGNGEKITVEGGMVVAQGGEWASGIGGGPKGEGKNIAITGGTVIATGGRDGAGIGGGNDGAGDNIAISGGTVIATGGTNGGAGIGGGDYRSGYSITISGGNVTAKSSSSKAAGIGGSAWGSGSDITISGGTVTAIGGYKAASIGGGKGEYNKSPYGVPEGVAKTIRILNDAKVYLGITNEDGTNASGYIGNGYKADEPIALSYEVDCTVTVAGNGETAQDVETTYRKDRATSEWFWDKIKAYIHFTPDSAGNVEETKTESGMSYTNGNLTINCHGHPEPEQPADQTNTGVISSTDPAAQRWYWVTALLDADENVGYTYEQIGSNLIVDADEAAQAAVLHVLLTGWAEHTEVQSITFVTAGKTTTLYASEMLGITTGEHLTLTHEYEKATLAVDGTDYTALLGEAVA